MTEQDTQARPAEDPVEYAKTIDFARGQVNRYAIKENHKEFLIIALGNTLFPQSILNYSEPFGLNEGRTRQCSVVVEGNASLRQVYNSILKKIRAQRQEGSFRAIPEPDEAEAQAQAQEEAPNSAKPVQAKREPITEQTPKAGNIQVDDIYETVFNPGEKVSTIDKILILLEEHSHRFPDIPVIETRIADHLGVSRQNISQMIRDSLPFKNALDERGLVLTKIPDGHYRLTAIPTNDQS